MNTVVQFSGTRTGDLGSESDPRFKAVILYEDPTTESRAKAAFDRLVTEFAESCTVGCNRWNFDVLANVQLRDVASSEAAQADLVILSGHSPADLPDAVKNWIWTWLPVRRAPGGALALNFDDCAECERGARPTASPVCVALRRAATAGRMDFVCPRPEWRKTAEEVFVQKMMARAHQTSTVLEGILGRRSAPRWGLNE
jgi:hypothetical protein